MRARRGVGAAGAVLAVLIAWLPSRSAHADPTAIRLELAAPAECPSREALARELDRLLGDAGGRGTPLEVHATVELRKDGRYHLSLQLEREGARSSRALDSKSCTTLTDAAALVIALAHDPEAVEARRATVDTPAPLISTGAAPPVPAPALETAAPSPALAPAAAPAAAPTFAPLQLAPAPQSETSPFGFVVRFGPMFGVADLPDAHAGLEGTLGLRVAEYTAELAFDLALGTTGTVDTSPSRGADFRLLVGVARACRALYPFFDRAWPRPSLAPEIAACAGVEVGAMSGVGFGVAHPEEGTAAWVAPRVDGRFALGVAGPLSLGLDVGMAIPVDRRRFVIQAGDTLVVHEPGPIAGRLGAAAEIGF